ncbi:MAG: hypothetical protein M1824_000635 [Vezdaea acicularis]|nr:MAG: hypothetical protein M1824_000635 [Vezdaea acicularis]
MAEWAKLKVVELKAELKKRGLLQTGLKPALIERLQKADEADSDSQVPVDNAARSTHPDPSVQAAPQPQDVEAPSPEDSLPRTQDAPLETHKQIPGPEFEPQTSARPDDDHSLGRPKAAAQQAEIAREGFLELQGPDAVPQILTSSYGNEGQPSPGPVHDTMITTDDEHPEDPYKQNQDFQTSPELRENEIATANSNMSDVAQTPINDLSEISNISPIDDSKKRKRRSQSPPPLAADITVKRAKQDTGLGVALDADNDGHIQQPSGLQTQTSLEDEAITITTRTGGASTATTLLTPVKDTRFKDLFSETAQKPLSVRQGDSTEGNIENVEEDHEIEPALHPATSALYIRNFMRPLQPPVLKKHLTALAAPPSSSPDPETLIADFYIDPVRTHCLASFSSVSAAARVRSAIHNRVWPNERTRKPLWADFVPTEKVAEWIELEKAASDGGRMSTGKRWEVVYDESASPGGTSSSVQAMLQEVGAGGRQGRGTGAGSGAGTSMKEPFVSPRGVQTDTSLKGADSVAGPSGPHNKPAPTSRVAGFGALDSLFKSTSAKPKLYYQPVNRNLANRRLDSFRSGSRAWRGRGNGNELRRYTFEDGDAIVDRGIELDRSQRGWRGRGGNQYGGWRGRG